jgi:hypothetical protein
LLVIELLVPASIPIASRKKKHFEPNKEPFMSKKFAGKIAVITGGSTGMGLATAKRFVQASL